MDAIRYFRGLGPARRRLPGRLFTVLCLLALFALTVVAIVQEFG